MATVLYWDRTEWQSLRFHLDSAEWNMVFEAEMLGLLLEVELIS